MMNFSGPSQLGLSAILAQALQNQQGQQPQSGQMPQAPPPYPQPPQAMPAAHMALQSPFMSDDPQQAMQALPNFAGAAANPNAGYASLLAKLQQAMQQPNGQPGATGMVPGYGQITGPNIPSLTPRYGLFGS